MIWFFYILQANFFCLYEYWKFFELSYRTKNRNKNQIERRNFLFRNNKNVRTFLLSFFLLIWRYTARLHPSLHSSRVKWTNSRAGGRDFKFYPFCSSSLQSKGNPIQLWKSVSKNERQNGTMHQRIHTKKNQKKKTREKLLLLYIFRYHRA